MTITGFTATIILNMHTDLVQPGVDIGMRNSVLANINIQVIDTGIPAISKSPANATWLFVVVMGGKRFIDNIQWIRSRAHRNSFKICVTTIGTANTNVITFPRFATACIENIYAYFIYPGIGVGMMNRIRS
jgi:hypothetical protein